MGSVQMDGISVEFPCFRQIAIVHSCTKGKRKENKQKWRKAKKNEKAKK